MTRKLATVRKVLDIRPIENADAIELAIIGGWQCVVKKGDFKVGDLGVYFEIDSFMPVEPRYEFLRKSSYRQLPTGEEGFRLRTVRLRGALSQGLLLPMTDFSDLPVDTYDLTSFLKIAKYEPPMPACLAGDAVGAFPSDIPKTDAERIQNLPEYFEQYKDAEFEVTEKLDGSSCTLFRNNDKLGVCSRNWEMKESDRNTYWLVAKKILPYIGKNLALQGEVVGEGIQKNPLKIRGQKFYLFTVYDLDLHVYLDPERRMLCFEALRRAGAELEHVPIIEPRIKLFSAYPTMEALLSYADGKSVICKGADREGLVFKPWNYGLNTATPWSYGATIFKAISNAHLLKQKD